MLEIVSPEWQYSCDAKGDFENILQVKEQRRLGTSRGNTCTPQAPVIEVRIRKDYIEKGILEKGAFVKADLWSYGAAYQGKNTFNRLVPDKIGAPFTKLRSNTYITCTENVEKLVDEKNDGYCYAKLKCFVTRGARVYCRKNHVALRLSVVLKDNGNFREVDNIPCIRTARLSISEKAMCPRESDRKRKSASDDESQEHISQVAKKIKTEVAQLQQLAMAQNALLLPPLMSMQPMMLPSLLQSYASQQALVHQFTSKTVGRESIVNSSARELLVNDLLNFTKPALTPNESGLALLKSNSTGKRQEIPMLFPPSTLFS